ncbi:hypothetical protein [Spirosoma validum]|uniref:Uncharacterized protein n=1 Tax=Spirosoma validum TaxID=2771355 RepID=A0A927B930_9BACT|nr:hypothetical protein [Spirosoma validum]MBD2757503.1 hypothetical protein [Spirosoma validum]
MNLSKKEDCRLVIDGITPSRAGSSTTAGIWAWHPLQFRDSQGNVDLVLRPNNIGGRVPWLTVVLGQPNSPPLSMTKRRVNLLASMVRSRQELRRE